MDYFENTTRITEEGYTAILRMKRRQQRIVCRAVSVVLAVPFVQRLVYYLLLIRIKGGSLITIGFLDILFLLLLAAAVWLWCYPQKQIKEHIRRTRDRIDLQAVNQYTFLPDGVHMMSTSSMEKFRLDYADLTWIRNDRHWIVLYFSRQDLTMLVDRQGFTHGSAGECLTFLKDKLDGK
ncbi:MAG: hypothetical protein ACI4XB_05245 [Ruminococcus sp.]